MRLRRASVAMALSGAVALLCTGCIPQMLADDAHAARSTTVRDCTDQRPADLPDSGSDYVPPVDNPTMYAEARVHNDGRAQHQYSVTVDVYTRSGKKVGGLSGFVDTVKPGETGSGLLIGDMSIAMPSEGVECRIDEVHAESSPWE